MTDHDAIRALLHRINDAWLKGPSAELPHALHECFHPEMVIKGPGLQTLAAGREACVKSYEEFLRQATVRDCKLSEPDIHLSGDTAVAACSWEMTYELAGQACHESGHDLFVFSRVAGRWLAVWRALLPATAS